MARRGLLPRLLSALAGMVRALAEVLERVAGERRPAASLAAVQALAERFPGAPDHWLEMIAERAPHLAKAPEEVRTVAEEAAQQHHLETEPRRWRLPARPWRSVLGWPKRAKAPPGARPAPEAEVARPAIEAEGVEHLAAAPPKTEQPSPPSSRPAMPRPDLRLAPADRSRRANRAVFSKVEPTADRKLPTSPEGQPAPRLRPLLAFGPRPLAREQTALAQPDNPSTHAALPVAFRAGEAPTRTTAAPIWMDPAEGDRQAPVFSARQGPADQPEGFRTWSRPGSRADRSTAEPPSFAPAHHDPARHWTSQPRDRSVAAERAAFREQADDRWASLPPADQGEVAPEPTTEIARHIREQELGGWNA